jgi:hypothetical protein
VIRIGVQVVPTPALAAGEATVAHAESAGLDSVWLPDHLMAPYAESVWPDVGNIAQLLPSPHAWLDPVPVIAALAEDEGSAVWDRRHRYLPPASGGARGNRSHLVAPHPRPVRARDRRWRGAQHRPLRTAVRAAGRPPRRGARHHQAPVAGAASQLRRALLEAPGSSLCDPSLRGNLPGDLDRRRRPADARSRRPSRRRVDTQRSYDPRKLRGAARDRATRR